MQGSGKTHYSLFTYFVRENPFDIKMLARGYMARDVLSGTNTSTNGLCQYREIDIYKEKYIDSYMHRWTERCINIVRCRYKYKMCVYARRHTQTQNERRGTIYTESENAILTNEPSLTTTANPSPLHLPPGHLIILAACFGSPLFSCLSVSSHSCHFLPQSPPRSPLRLGFCCEGCAI